MSELNKRLIALSVSDAPDRARLGFPQREIDRAVLTICTALVRAGAEIGYGGNLDPNGYTFKIFRHLAGAYAGMRETPFHHFIPEPVARNTTYEHLHEALNEGRGVVQTKIARGDAFFNARLGGGGIRLDGRVVQNDAQLTAWFAEVPYALTTHAYSTARRKMAECCDARVIIGGKMGILADPLDIYDGAMPGIVEEAILALEAGKPLIVLGAFGGATRDIAIALGLLDQACKVPRTQQHVSYASAIKRIASLARCIPNEFHEELSNIADDDRSEQTAFQATSLIKKWLGNISVKQ
ncbi:hypothetical protein [Vreelandella neptunia]|uniref:Uncharacterized protein n=1 Tax=Vreelandella neptunia TaxID=115551 RepID=A0ABS9S463_9GAMM|nr:hypothetical protein [Halomonas neptunia]MCH4810915.1 hypothetical protein [Halomonas neptunia]